MLCKSLLSRGASLSANVRSLWTGRVALGLKDGRRTWIVTAPKKDEGAQGEKAAEIEVTGYSKLCEFPQLDTPDRIFDNMPYKEVPIVNIKSTKNNTLFSLTNSEGRPLYNRSCGVDGFKNCRKGTNIAAQVTATAFAKVITKMGYSTCRVCINGLGPGRMSAFKGLQMGGMNIISITDSTPIFDIPRQRPPAARSL